jgi:quinol monooxygenase YgiN
MIALVVTIKVKEGKQAEFEAMAKDLVAAVRANEPGVALYTLTKKEGASNEYVFMEQYRSQADLDAHGKTDHFQKAMPVFGACLDGRPDMVRLEVVA